MHSILERYSALLLDLNGTFMFDQDRFGSEEDYYSTYRSLGGHRLDESSVRSAVQACHTELSRLYQDPAHVDAFRSVSATLYGLPATSRLPAPERALIEDVIAYHEVGRIPSEYADLIRTLAGTHRLALVSNIWSKKDLYVAELRRAGVLEVFETLHFSSDGASMKPSRVLFDRAVAALGIPRGEAVVIGDSLRCDVGGATAAGLASVWIANGDGGAAKDDGPDWIIRDLQELVMTLTNPPLHGRLT